MASIFYNMLGQYENMVLLKEMRELADEMNREEKNWK